LSPVRRPCLSFSIQPELSPVLTAWGWDGGLSLWHSV
jgi:hypothetical protein